MGICRGMQFINICLGGSVYQDITDKQTEKHKDDVRMFNNYHEVRIESGCLLSDLLKKDEITINSTHHQAVKTLGENLKTAAVIYNGFIEANESISHMFCVGVQ